jgi:hypothetical protein
MNYFNFFLLKTNPKRTLFNIQSSKISRLKFETESIILNFVLSFWEGCLKWHLLNGF